MTGAATIAQRKPAPQMSATELQHEADAVALRMAVGKPLIGDSIVVLELANRLARVQPQELAS